MSWIRRLWNTVRRDRLQRDIDRELAFHLAERADQLREEGLSAEQAERTARLRFGNTLIQAERTRDVDIARWLDAGVRNVRYAIRCCMRSPVFSTTVIVTLAAGIGANVAVFSAVDAVLLRALPVPDSERLVRLLELVPAESGQDTQIAPGRLEDWASRNTSLEALAGYYVEDVSDTTGALPEPLRRAVVSPRFLDVWRISPIVGRDFSPIEYRTGSPPTVLISERYWRSRLDADPQVLTRVVSIEGQAFSIAGVMPASFTFPEPAVDVWWPYPIDAVAMTSTPANRRHRWYTGIGRIKAGVTPEQARADLQRVQESLATEFPRTDAGISVRVAPLKQAIVGNVGASLWLLYGAVSVLLLIASLNIAALWLSRAARRQHEVSLRLALGASRATVAAQLIVESGVLAAAGAALGLATAYGLLGAMPALLPDLPRRHEIAIDGRMVLYTVATAVVATIICSLVPVLRTAGRAQSLTPSSSDRTQLGGRLTAQWWMVGAQMTLATALIIGAGLLLRSAAALSRVEPGFDPGQVLAFRVSANWTEADDRGGLAARIDRTLTRLAALPGIEATATAWSLPGVPRRYQAEFASTPARTASEPPIAAEWRSVAPSYFDVLRIPMVSGERCRIARPEQATAQLIVNQAFTARYFRDRSPIGSHLSWESGSLRGRVVGVAGDVRESGLDRPAPPTVYTCDSAPTPFPWMLVRTQGDPDAMAAAIRLEMKAIEPLRSVYDLATLEHRLAGAYATARARMSLFVAFAATSLFLGCLGVYATLSYAVSLRRREMGLRLALGARRSELVHGIVRQALRVVVVACAPGAAIAFLLRHTLAGMLYGVAASDPWTPAVVIVLIISVTAVAAVVPALRVTALQPMQVLRDE